jgi:hypothetical protein
VRHIRHAALLLFLGGTSVSAQSSNPEAQTAARTSAFQNLTTLPSVGKPSSRGLSGSVDIAATEDVGSIAIVIGPKHRDDFSLGLSVSGPLSESTKTAQPLSLDGLANAAKAEFGLHWFVWTGVVNIAEGKAICKRNVGREDCDDSEIVDPRERMLFLRSQAADKDPITIDVHGEYSRTQFEYLEPGSFSAAADSHSSRTFSVAVGRYTPALGYVLGGYEFAHSWEAAGAPRQICTPLNGTALECRTATVGAPSGSDKHILRLAWRRFMFNGRAAIDPVFEWNPKEHLAGVTVPIYGFTKKNEGFAGGVKVGWRSDTDDLTAVVFVGVAIGILK